MATLPYTADEFIALLNNAATQYQNTVDEATRAEGKAEEAAESAEAAAKAAAEAKEAKEGTAADLAAVESAKDEVEIFARSAESNAELAAASANTAIQYSGNPAKPINGTWWIWDAAQQTYVDTGIKAVMSISHSYPSIADMEADKEGKTDGDLAIIASEINDDDNSKLFVFNGEDWVFLSDLSGIQGVGIGNIQLTEGDHSPGTTDTYTITLTDGTEYTIQIYNGRNGNGVEKVELKSGTHAPGTTDTYTMTFTDGDTFDFTVRNGDNGVGITSVALTDGAHAPGTLDTYTITFSNGSKTTFQVYNGADGEGNGDMLSEIYDPQKKNTDIFQYVDDAEARAAAKGEAENSLRLVEGEASQLPSSGTWTYICFAGDKFIVSPYMQQILAISEEGTRWRTQSSPSKLPGSSTTWGAAAYGNGKYVCLSSDATYGLISDDCESWSQFTIPSRNRAGGIAFGAGKFISLATNGTYDYSTDGENWSTSTIPFASDTWGLIFADNKFVTVCTNGKDIVAYSIDGDNWQKGTLPEKGYWASVAYGNGRYIAISTSVSAKSAYSFDCETWYSGATPPFIPRKIAFGNGKFVIVGKGDEAAYSADGEAWTVVKMPASQNWYDVAYGAGKFVALARTWEMVALSSDGVTWSTSLPGGLFLKSGEDVTEEIKTLLAPDMGDVEAQLAQKADLSYMNTELAKKADTTDLANKQDKLKGTLGQMVGFDASGNAIAQAVPATGLTEAQGDARYLKLSGGTLTGALTLNANPTANLGAATKQYVDSAVADKATQAYVNNAIAAAIGNAMKASYPR